MLAEFRKRLPEDELDAGVVVAGLGTVSTPRVEGKSAEATSAVAKTDAEPATATPAADGTAAAAKSGAGARAPASTSPEDEAPLNIVAEVVNKYPNGNVLLRGMKRFAHNGRNYAIEVTGIARANDISEDDRISAAKFFEYKTEMFQ
jgi:flagellar basal body L-ring protein FlgH